MGSAHTSLAICATRELRTLLLIFIHNLIAKGRVRTRVNGIKKLRKQTNSKQTTHRCVSTERIYRERKSRNVSSADKIEIEHLISAHDIDL